MDKLDAVEYMTDRYLERYGRTLVGTYYLPQMAQHNRFTVFMNSLLITWYQFILGLWMLEKNTPKASRKICCKPTIMWNAVRIFIWQFQYAHFVPSSLSQSPGSEEIFAILYYPFFYFYLPFNSDTIIVDRNIKIPHDQSSFVDSMIFLAT